MVKATPGNNRCRGSIPSVARNEILGLGWKIFGNVEKYVNSRKKM